MHSNTRSNPFHRITPYLVTVGLGLAIPAQAAEPESPDDMQAEVPAATIDSDGDGQPDLLDGDGDGQPDPSDGDGQPD
tara:strand:+ start:113 stop:346 length:234 start_codon:yes stop_codon:yes gene_type:complete